MSLNRTCAVCAAPLPEDADDGAMCPDCEFGAQNTVIEPSPAGSVVAPRVLQTIGGFEILEKLGQGGMGSVYRARQVSLDRMVAFKVLPQQLAEDAEFVARFQREARVAAGLRHPNLVGVYAFGVADGCHYIAMELIEGENLHQRLKRGLTEIAEALAICAEVARGLQHAWNSARLVHRDIKPSNIYVSDSGEVKVGDLGLAKSLGGDTTGLTQSGLMMGTPHYMSPEQARGDKAIDFHADIYSLGCTLFEMLTGHPPYPGKDPIAVVRQHLDNPPPALLKALPACPLPLALVVGKMLKKSHRERQPSYEALIAELEDVHAQIERGKIGMRSVSQHRPPAPAPRTTGTTAEAKMGMWLGIVLLCLIAGLVAFIVMPSRNTAQEPGAGVTPLPATLPSAPPASQKNPALQVSPSSPAVLAAKKDAVLPDVADLPAGITPAIVNETGFAPLFGADGIRDWRQNTAANWDFSGSVLSCRTNTRNTTRLWCPKNFAPADFEIRFAMRGNRGPAFEFRRNAGANDDCYMCDPAALRTGGNIFWDERQNGKFAKPGQRVRITRDDQREELSKLTELPKWKDGDWNEVTLIVQGNHFSCTCNGTLVAEVTDESPSYRAGPGDFGFRVTNNTDQEISAEFRDIRIKRLPATPTAARPVPSAEPWQDALRDPAKLVLTGAAARTPEGLRFTDLGGAMRVPGDSPKRDGSVRMTTTFGGLRPQLLARNTKSAGHYQLYAIDAKTILFNRWDQAARKSITLHAFPLREPLQPGQDYELELRAVGQTFSAKLNGEILGTVTDGILSQGPFGVGVTVHNAAPVLVKALEVLDLDAPGGASTMPADATKGAPFVNTLGMKFVPVSITGGPANGQRVLFSVWETRVQDYAAFATETRREWPKPDFEQGPTHPAVQMSWEDATAFCVWLTERERKAGRIGPQDTYRLPGDHEWSCAAGIGEREDAAKTPEEKNTGLPDLYAWGSAWPPPAGAGNFNGTETEGKALKYVEAPLKDYRDDFPTTAPVGSFPPNRWGLHDLSGNVWERCEDLFRPGGTTRVVRGGAFSDNTPEKLKLSCRIDRSPEHQSVFMGFRCVLSAAPAR